MKNLPFAASYFNQQKVTAVRQGDNGEWSIDFNGGGYIRNLSSDVPLPHAIIIGKALRSVSFDGEITTLDFGVPLVQLETAKYALMHPAYTEGLIYPGQQAESSSNLPPDPSADRLADGPSEPEEDEG